MDVKDKTINQTLNQPKNVENSTLNNTQEKGDVGYVKELFTDQQIYTSGVIYRYVNNIDPNKDLICGLVWASSAAVRVKTLK